MNVRLWLRRCGPSAVAFRCDGRSIVKLGAGGSRYAHAEEAILELGADLLEALDGEGNVLRATRLTNTSDDALELPAAPAPTPGAPADVQALARVIMEAGDRGASRHAEAYKAGNEQLISLVRILADRLSGLERAWVASLNAQARAVANATPPAPADEAGAAVAAMVGQLVTGAASSAAPAANGKGRS